MTRQILGILALAASASVAAAQPQPPSKSPTPAKRHMTRTASRGEVASSQGSSTHAVARDWVRADDTRGDDLWRREQMMDQKCGKDRDRCGKP